MSQVTMRESALQSVEAVTFWGTHGADEEKGNIIKLKLNVAVMKFK